MRTSADEQRFLALIGAMNDDYDMLLLRRDAANRRGDSVAYLAYQHDADALDQSIGELEAAFYAQPTMSWR